MTHPRYWKSRKPSSTEAASSYNENFVAINFDVEIVSRVRAVLACLDLQAR